MAMHIPRAPGYSSMLKEGAQHYKGLEDAVFRNIEACVAISKTTASCYGPNGMKKMIINHLEKLIVTNDAATILSDLEVAHPAAKLMVLACNQQQHEAGDGTNLIMVLAGALLQHAEEPLRNGLTPADVVSGYKMSCKKSLEILKTLECLKVTDLMDKTQVSKPIRAAIMSKHCGMEDFLSNLIAEACISVNPAKGYFNVDNVRVCKILGSGVFSSTVVQGMVFKQEIHGDVKAADHCKVVVYTCPLESLATETKGTVLIKTAQELKSFSKGEEDLMDSQIKAIADAGVKVIVAGGKVAEIALHYCNKYKLFVIRLSSKFDIRRLAKVLGASPLTKLDPPTADELGYVDFVTVSEIGDTNVVIFKLEKQDTSISTIIVRGSTENIMDDVERAIDDGVNTYKCLTKDSKLIAGAGATEIELASQLQVYGASIATLEQYAIAKYAASFEDVVKTLADNAGLKSTEIISQLYAAHGEGKKTFGLLFNGADHSVADALAAGIVDTLLSKQWAIKFATDVACTILLVDQIIMSKPSGGPKPKENKAWDNDD